jgi:hypothetical protein
LDVNANTSGDDYLGGCDDAEYDSQAHAGVGHLEA